MPDDQWFDVMSGLATRVDLAGAHQKPARVLTEGPDEVTVLFNFCEKGFGFGEFCIRQTRDGVFVDTEEMGIEKIKYYLGLLLDCAIADTDDDLEKHRRYCAAMNRTCGPACPVDGGIAMLERTEAQLAERLGLTGNVREQLIKLAEEKKLVEDELVADWHEGYAWYLAWRAEVEHEDKDTP